MRNELIANQQAIFHFSFLIPHFSFLISHFSFLISHFSFLISHFSFLRPGGKVKFEFLPKAVGG